MMEPGRAAGPGGPAGTPAKHTRETKPEGLSEKRGVSAMQLFQKLQFQRSARLQGDRNASWVYDHCSVAWLGGKAALLCSEPGCSFRSTSSTPVSAMTKHMKGAHRLNPPAELKGRGGARNPAASPTQPARPAAGSAGQLQQGVLQADPQVIAAQNPMVQQEWTANAQGTALPKLGGMAVGLSSSLHVGLGLQGAPSAADNIATRVGRSSVPGSVHDHFAYAGDNSRQQQQPYPGYEDPESSHGFTSVQPTAIPALPLQPYCSQTSMPPASTLYLQGKGEMAADRGLASGFSNPAHGSPASGMPAATGAANLASQACSRDDVSMDIKSTYNLLGTSETDVSSRQQQLHSKRCAEAEGPEPGAGPGPLTHPAQPSKPEPEPVVPRRQLGESQASALPKAAPAAQKEPLSVSHTCVSRTRGVPAHTCDGGAGGSPGVTPMGALLQVTSVATRRMPGGGQSAAPMDTEAINTPVDVVMADGNRHSRLRPRPRPEAGTGASEPPSGACEPPDEDVALLRDFAMQAHRGDAEPSDGRRPKMGALVLRVKNLSLALAYDLEGSRRWANWDSSAEFERRCMQIWQLRLMTLGQLAPHNHAALSDMGLYGLWTRHALCRFREHCGIPADVGAAELSVREGSPAPDVRTSVTAIYLAAELTMIHNLWKRHHQEQHAAQPPPSLAPNLGVQTVASAVSTVSVPLAEYDPFPYVLEELPALAYDTGRCFSVEEAQLAARERVPQVRAALREVQGCPHCLGLPVAEVDGIWGPATHRRILAAVQALAGQSGGEGPSRWDF